MVDIILEVLNDCFEEAILPTEFELAQVVTLCKKRNVENPANYRPNSLLQSLYKIYASILQTRLAGADDRIQQVNRYSLLEECRISSNSVEANS